MKQTIIMISLIIILLVSPTQKAIAQPFESNIITLNDLLAQLKEEVAEDKAREALSETLTSTIMSIQGNLTREEAEEIINLVHKYSVEKEVDTYWMLAIIYTESTFNEGSTSNVGAKGLMQVMPITAKFCGVDPSANLYNKELNIQTGVGYYKYLEDELGSQKMATIAYNQGIGNVRKGTYRTWYYDRVVKNYNKIIEIYLDLLNNREGVQNED